MSSFPSRVSSLSSTLLTDRFALIWACARRAPPARVPSSSRDSETPSVHLQHLPGKAPVRPHPVEQYRYVEADAVVHDAEVRVALQGLLESSLSRGVVGAQLGAGMLVVLQRELNRVRSEEHTSEL